MANRSPLSGIWPLYDLVVRTPRLELRYPDDADLAVLARLPDEGIHEPGRSPFEHAWAEGPSRDRQLQSFRYWRSTQATWSPDAWSIDLAVVVDGEILGSQGMRAEGFRLRRSVDTGSWLVRRAQGAGIGTEMREAVLELAFGGLGALEALSGAFEWNTSSIRVSEKVGYRENGARLAVNASGRHRRLSFRMTREDWLSRRRSDIEVVGLERCRELFGIADGAGSSQPPLGDA
jgi:RimJ/RimL family protein N-acetyltransferase